MGGNEVRVIPKGGSRRDYIQVRGVYFDPNERKICRKIDKEREREKYM